MATKQQDETNWIFDESGEGTEKIRKKLHADNIQRTDDLIEKLSKDSTNDEILEKLINAKLEDVGNQTNAYKESLQTVISGIFKNTEVIGKEFDELRKFNDIEQGLINEAKRIVQEANDELNEVKNWGEWRNLLFGWKKSAIKEREQLVTQAVAKAQELETKAAMLFDERLRTAGIEELLDQFRHMTTIGVNNLNRIADDNTEEYEQVKIRHEKAIEIVQKAAITLKQLLEKYNTADQKLKDETAHLDTFQNGSPEYAAQRKVIDTAQQEFDAIKAERDKMQAAYNSKEKFSAILQTNMTALKVSTGNIRALAIKLRSDNEERERTYRTTVQLIKAAKQQESSSAIDSLGDETDQKNLEVAVYVASASEKDALERLYKHPKNMQRVLSTIEAFSQVLENDKKQIRDYQELIKGGYDDIDAGQGPKKESSPDTKKELTTEELVFEKS